VASPTVDWKARDIDAIDSDIASISGNQAYEHIKTGRFASAVRP
jgi:hypothetical protein